MAAGSMEHALSPVLFISRLFGIAPFTPNLQCTTFYTLYSLLVFIVLIASTGYSLAFLYEMDEPLYSNILRLSLDRFEFTLCTLSASLSIVCSFMARAQTITVFRDLESIDDILKKNGIRISFDRTQYIFGSLFRLFLVLTGITIEHLFVTTLNSVKRVIFFICQFLPMFIAHFTEYQHNVILNTIQKRFNCLKEELIRIKKRQNLNKQAELESLVKVYNYLVEISGVINEIYGKQVLLIVGNIFLMTTANLDYVVEGIIELVLNKGSPQTEEMFAFGYWATVRLVELWSVVKTCEAVLLKAKEFSAALYQYMIEEGAETCKNKKIRLHLTVQKEPYFSAHGFFALDFTLLHSEMREDEHKVPIKRQSPPNTAKSRWMKWIPKYAYLLLICGAFVESTTISILGLTMNQHIKEFEKE